ncbi:cytochrome P450 monooxygenase CYP539B5 [Xylariaceae sp. AK1471]|nr:cytochrome P450 monooxygenase CYP539B5 [Xylariaceae sp. AK1471]
MFLTSNLTLLDFGVAFGSLLFFAFSFFTIRYIQYETRIRRIGGVRAPSLGRTPIAGALWSLRAVHAFSKHRLLEYFTDNFNRVSSSSAAAVGAGCDVVEVQMGVSERFIITREPEHIKTMLTTKFGDFGKGPKLQKEWKAFLGHSVFTTDGPQWQENRGLIRPMLMKDRVTDLDIFERYASKMISKIPLSVPRSGHSNGDDGGSVVDMMDLFYRMTLDITTDFLFGATSNSLDNPANEFARAFNETQRRQMVIAMLGPFAGFAPKAEFYASIATIDKFVSPYVDAAAALPAAELEKITKSDKGFTFLHSIMQYTRDKRLLRDQLVGILIAGRDTSAATLSWTFYELSRYPDKVRRLREEILGLVGRDRLPTYDDLKNMTYLRHTLNETLRLYPAIPYSVRRALKDSTLPNGPGNPPISVVEGDAVIYAPLAMHRRSDLYPPTSAQFEDPALFSPERWEHWTPKAWHYVPFSGGPRICIGQNFAMTEMAFVVIRILQNFERFEYVGDWSTQYQVPELVIRPGNGVPLRFFQDKST